MTDDQVAKVPVTVCIAMSEGGTFLSAFADTHWIQEDRKHQDLLKRVREDKQLWSVKYIRTSIQYPITTEKKDKFIGTITNYTDLELRLQTEVAELKVSLEKEQALTAHHRTVQVELLSKVAELKADNENLRAYAKHERSLGAEAFAMENLDLTQQVEILKAKLAETEQARALIMQTLANTVVERDTLKAKLAEYEADEDFECPTCGEVNPSTSCGSPNCGLLLGGTL